MSFYVYIARVSTAFIVNKCGIMIRSFNVEAIKHHGTVKNVHTCRPGRALDERNYCKTIMHFQVFFIYERGIFDIAES
jgi:hypothetical protein